MYMPVGACAPGGTDAAVCQIFHRVGQRRARCGGKFSPLPGMGCRIRPGEATLKPGEPGGVHVNSVYLALMALGVPALTFTGLWFWRLRYQRRAGGQLTETEIAARIAARQYELRQEREARDERLAGLIGHLLQNAVDARSLLQNAADAGTESHATQHSAPRASSL